MEIIRSSEAGKPLGITAQTDPPFLVRSFLWREVGTEQLSFESQAFKRELGNFFSLNLDLPLITVRGRKDTAPLQLDSKAFHSSTRTLSLTI